jgi:dihydropteroate synthase
MVKIPKIVGIVNVTPDSFSDGGEYAESSKALQHIEALISQGADVIDIGAESTRPHAPQISPQEEWRRLEAVLQCRNNFPKAIPWSVDTRHAQTAQHALACGVDWINDVSGAADEALLRSVAAFPQACYVLMHSLTIPADPAVTLEGQEPVSALIDFAVEKLARCEAAGIARDRVIFDPGIGFGKSPEQSIELLKRAEIFKHKPGLPLFIGHSRKSFFNHYFPSDAAGRDAATLTVSLELARKGVDYIRVHDVASHHQALNLWKDWQDV